MLLKREKGGLSAEDERRFRDLRRRLEGEILEHADVVCTTCVGAGDPRLHNFRFQHVSSATGSRARVSARLNGL